MIKDFSKDCSLNSEVSAEIETLFDSVISTVAEFFEEEA